MKLEFSKHIFEK